MDRAVFFKTVRNSPDLFRGSLSATEVEGMETILDECVEQGSTLEQTAYILGTAFGESGGRMQPVRENMNYSAKRIPQVFSAKRRRGVPIKKLAHSPMLLANTVYATTLGNRPNTDDGWNFRGGGIGQITGRYNYRKWGDKLGLPLVKNPDLLMDLDVSVEALVVPMLEGWATGHRLDEFVNDRIVDYYNARRVWNGTFEARKYADYALEFERALRKARFGDRSVRPQQGKPVGAPSAAMTKANGGLLAALVTLAGTAAVTIAGYWDAIKELF